MSEEIKDKEDPVANELSGVLMVPEHLNPTGIQLRMAGTADEPLFCLADVCQVLGIARANDKARELDDDEKGAVLTRTPGGTQEMTYVTEAGLYTVLLRSDKPAAKPFRQWVTREVLPCIRKYGCYPAPKEGRPAEMALGQVMAVVLELASEVGTIRQQIEQQQCLAQAVPHSHSASAPRMVREYVREAFWEDCPERVLADIVGTFRTRYQSFYGYWPPNPGGQVACEEDRLRFVEKAFRHHYRKCFPTKQRELTFPEQKQSVQFGGAVVAPLVPPPPANPTLPPPAPPAGPGEHQAVS